MTQEALPRFIEQCREKRNQFGFIPYFFIACMEFSLGESRESVVSLFKKLKGEDGLIPAKDYVLLDEAVDEAQKCVNKK